MGCELVFTERGESLRPMPFVGMFHEFIGYVDWTATFEQGSLDDRLQNRIRCGDHPAPTSDAS